ncbi:YycC family protein [Bacillus sp. A301a_S52]|nr:YycC family protein [Bacillus sp. A301a_S52]
MRPNQISLETAQMISKKLKMPLEHVMHTPPHILMEKLKRAELSETDSQESTDQEN